MLMRILLLLFLKTFLFSNTPEIGKPAPNFILHDQDDQIHKLDDYKSKKLVIYFFPKAETPGWIKQACGFRDEFQNFEEFDISILGVSFDSQKVLKNFKLKHNLPFNFLSDSNKEMGSDYGVNKYYFFPSRKTFLIDEKGILIHIFDDIDLYSHPKDVLSFFNKDLKE